MWLASPRWDAGFEVNITTFWDVQPRLPVVKFSERHAKQRVRCQQRVEWLSKLPPDSSVLPHGQTCLRRIVPERQSKLQKRWYAGDFNAGISHELYVATEFTQMAPHTDENIVTTDWILGFIGHSEVVTKNDYNIRYFHTTR
jgi:hypothetical protein